MPKHEDFKKIYARFVKQYGDKKGKDLYFAWLSKNKYDDTIALSGQKKKEKKELLCHIRGIEIKETPTDFHIEGLIATSHVDNLDLDQDIDVPDMIPKETLESFANQINTLDRARVMGEKHSEGRSINAEYYGVADIENNPAKVIELTDGQYGLYVDTKLIKDDPYTPTLIQKFQTKELDSFSITYDTDGFSTTDFDFIDDKLVRILNPETQLFGYTASYQGKAVNPNAITTGYGFKEFKELVGVENNSKGVQIMKEKKEDEDKDESEGKPSEDVKEEKPIEEKPIKEEPVKELPKEDDAEEKEFKKAWKTEQKERTEKEAKEHLVKQADLIAERVNKKMEVKEKVLKEDNAPKEQKEIPLEFKEFGEVFNNREIELKEQARRAGAFCDVKGIDWTTAVTPRCEAREYKNFGTNGRNLEFKGLSMTTNQNADTDYLQSAAELQDVYDPVIYNALNQNTLTWNLLAKDDFSKKGNNKVQFTLKTVANTSAAFYLGNAVVTGYVGRLKYETKFKKVQVGVSVDGDLIAAAVGGPVGDVFAQEVMDSTLDMLAVVNANLFGIVGLETAAETIGFEFIAHSGTYTTMYNLARDSSTNLLSPDAAADTYIDGASAVISMFKLRSAITQAVTEGANKANLVFITNPLQGDILRGKFDDARRMLTSKDTDLGFSTDLWVDGIPVFEDKDCNTDDWWLIDLETHRVAIWKPPTLEKLGKTADSEDAFIKMYFAVYNRAPRRLCMIYNCATS